MWKQWKAENPGGELEVSMPEEVLNVFAASRGGVAWTWTLGKGHQHTSQSQRWLMTLSPNCTPF